MSNYQLVDPLSEYTSRQLQSAFRPIDSQSAQQLASSSSTDLPETQTVQRADLSTATSNGLIHDLKNYRYDYFLSRLSCPFDMDYGQFGSPSGICTLPDDRLLVANFARDSLLLLDINGNVHQLYRDIPQPKDVLYYSTNPSQAIIAAKKEALIFDLEKKVIVARSKLRGFYPWNIQHLREHNILAACDPSGERIVFLDPNLNEIGGWSFTQQHQNQMTPYQKIYPYAACFFSNNTSFVLTHVENRCELKKCDSRTGALINTCSTPAGLISYAILDDGEGKCLIADKGNHSLLSIRPDQTFQQYTFKSVQEPYSMTFLSNGTLCVTDRSLASRSNGGIAILSEFDLKTK